MKILIIDDSDYKIDSLQSVLRECDMLVDYEVARSFQGGIKKIQSFSPDLILLDMTLPTSERANGELEGRIRLFGGREILSEIDFLELHTKAIIVTQFDRFGEGKNSIDLDTLIQNLITLFKDTVLGGVYYSSIDSTWREKLRLMIEDASKLK